MRLSSPQGRSVHSDEGSESSVPPAGARRPEGELGEARRGYRPVVGGGERLAPIRGPGMGGMRGSIADTIASARASLKNPSRPFTPADPLRRLSAHSLLPRGEHGPAPPTPLIETSNFEGERPFTQHRRKTSLPATGGLGAPFGALEGAVGSGGLRMGSGGQHTAEVLSLYDDAVDTQDIASHEPSQRPSSRSGRVRTAARKENGAEAEAGDDAAAAAVWILIQAQLPALVKQGRTSGGGERDREGEAARVMVACDAILGTLTNFETVQVLSTEQRSAIVKAAAGYTDDCQAAAAGCLDMKEPVDLVAKAGKVILAVTKGGANLLAVAKLFFRLSKTPANDAVLRGEGVCECVVSALRAGGRLESVLGHVARLSEQCELEVEAVMLLFAVLKNMTTDSDTCRLALMRHAALTTTTAWVRALVRERRQRQEQEERKCAADGGGGGGGGGGRGGGGVAGTRERESGQRMKVCAHLRSLLLQCTALLRNLAVLSAYRDEFVACGTIRGIVEVMTLWSTDAEVLLNASRLLSKVSMTPSCQEEMAAIQPSVHATLLQVVEHQQAQLPLLVRVVFVLGSLTSSDEDHRLKIYEHEGVLEMLLSILDTHVEALLSADGDGASDGQHLMHHPSQDVLVKLIRLLAHLAISSEVGPEMGKFPQVQALLRVMEAVPIQTCEELVLNTVSLITNLTYYASANASSVLWESREALVSLLADMIFVENQEAVLESARAFGNLSRCAQVRKKMHDTRVDEALVLLLDHSEPQVVAAAAGVVVNLAGDKDCMSTELQSDALVMLLEALSRCDASSPQVEQSCTICHAIFNLCATMDWQLDGLVASQLVQTMEELIEELAVVMNERALQVDSALSNVAQRLARAIKTRCADAIVAAAPDMEALRREAQELQLRHERALAAEDDEVDDEEEEAGGWEATGRRGETVSMLEPLEGSEEDVVAH